MVAGPSLRKPRGRRSAMLRGGMCSNCYVANRFFPSKDYVVIDIHCHLLPEVDDGPKSWDIAVEMCRMAATDGITHAVATPHANDRYAYDREYLAGLLGQLREKIEEKIDPATIAGGCLLCSEDKPHHCHRRLVAEYLRERWGNLEISHIV